ncbi:MAG: hypothetical protein QOF06_566 [Solirubrobacterales bacterium]|jgi:hypothetical protein|nr:hypothetical protein [Solirubrobacterales bacterium]
MGLGASDRGAPAIAQIAMEGPQESAASFPQVSFATQGRQSQHFVSELRSGGWRKLQPALHRLGAGPLVGGPVLLGDRIDASTRSTRRTPNPGASPS